MTTTEPLNLDPIWDRSNTYMALWDAVNGRPTPEQIAAASATAEDVRALIAEVERLRDENDELRLDMEHVQDARDVVAAHRQMTNEANAALRAQILGALGEQDDGRTPLLDQLGQLIAEFVRYRRAVAEVRALHFQYLTAWADEYTCAGCNRGMELVLWPCDTIKAIDEAVKP